MYVLSMFLSIIILNLKNDLFLFLSTSNPRQNKQENQHMERKPNELNLSAKTTFGSNIAITYFGKI